MENINMEILYKILMNDLELTDRVLMVYGYSREEIDLLLEQGVIERKNNGQYKLLLVDKFRQYGVKQLKSSRIWEANKCFKKSYELAPNGKNICLQYLLASLKRRDFEEVFRVFDSLDKIQPEINNVNNNFYLYLLSFLTEVPEKYEERIKKLEYDDLMLSNTRGNRIENEFRGSVIRSKFKLAYKSLNTMLLRLSGYSPKFELIKELLSQVINAERCLKSSLLNFANEEKYEEIIAILKKRKSIRYLNNLDMYTLMIAEAILKVKENGVVDAPMIETADDIYQALVGNNFALALEINNKYNSRFNNKKDKDIINVLLIKLNDLILEINNKGNSLQYNNLIELDKDILDVQELAYYISSEGISLEDATSKFGLSSEIVLLIKLVYARDYYIERKYLEGDNLLREVENISNKSGRVLCFLDNVKNYRTFYKNNNVNLKKLVP